MRLVGRHPVTQSQNGKNRPEMPPTFEAMPSSDTKTAFLHELDPKRKSSLVKQPSLLMFRHPFAGHALGLGDLVGAAYHISRALLAFRSGGHI